MAACSGSEVAPVLLQADLPHRDWVEIWSADGKRQPWVDDVAFPIGGLLLRNGAIIAGAYGAAALLSFDTVSHSANQGGARGDGPGEFRSLHRIRRCSDNTIAAQDFANGRITFFSSQLELLDVATLPPRAMGGELVACNADRSLVMVNDPPFAPGDGVHVVKQVGNAVNLNTAEMSRLGEWAITSMVFDVRRQVLFPQPLGPRALVAGFGSRLVVVDAASCALRLLQDGDSRVIRSDWAPSSSRATGTARDRSRARILQNIVDTLTRREIADAMQRTPTGKMLPCAEAVVADADGHFWIGLHPVSGDSVATWLRLDEALQPAEMVTLPSSYRVLDIRSDRVLVARETEVQTLALLRLCDTSLYCRVDSSVPSGPAHRP